MQRIKIKTQAEWDALPEKFDQFTRIYIIAENKIYIGKAWGNASVEAWGNASVEAWGNASVEAWGNASVVARGNASVVARGNASVVARGNASVEAWGNASVEAWGNASVVAWGRVSVQVFSTQATILLFAFAVAIIAKTLKHKIKKKSKTSYIHKVGILGWFELNGIRKTKSIVLYKRVSKDFKTQEGYSWETNWEIGTTVIHPAWEPTRQECGSGKFHGVSRPYFADQFRSIKGDKYIAIRVALEDVFEWKQPSYPHKIGFRKGKVLYICDRFGKRLTNDQNL